MSGQPLLRHGQVAAQRLVVVLVRDLAHQVQAVQLVHDGQLHAPARLAGCVVRHAQPVVRLAQLRHVGFGDHLVAHCFVCQSDIVYDESRMDVMGRLMVCRYL